MVTAKSNLVFIKIFKIENWKYAHVFFFKLAHKTLLPIELNQLDDQKNYKNLYFISKYFSPSGSEALMGLVLGENFPNPALFFAATRNSYDIPVVRLRTTNSVSGIMSVDGRTQLLDPSTQYSTM